MCPTMRLLISMRSRIRISSLQHTPRTRPSSFCGNDNDDDEHTWSISRARDPRACARRVAATNRARLCRRITRRCTIEVSIRGCACTRAVSELACTDLRYGGYLRHVRRFCGTKGRDERRREQQFDVSSSAHKTLMIAQIAN